MATRSARPVETLREHATAFEAALSVCLGSPRPKAVHKLRTESRRLEAQIALLQAMPGLPAHRKQADKVLRAVARFRRAAGHVRDLDVQSKALAAYAKRKPHPPQAGPNMTEAQVVAEAPVAESETAGSEAAPSAVAESHVAPSAQADVPSAAETQQQRADDLRKMIATREQRREHVAADLIALIEQRQAKASAALEALLRTLHPAQKRSLAAVELVRIADRRFHSNRALTGEKLSDEALHSIRKAAKQARYLAETSEASAAVAAAKRYEQLQEAGGRWHDWLDLAQVAKKELGRKHAVTAEFSALRDRRLAAYNQLLASFRPTSIG